MYKSEFYPTPKMAEQFYQGQKISAKTISSKMAYTNKKYAEMVAKSPKKNVTYYGVYREYVTMAEILDIRLKKSNKRGIIKSKNEKTGEIEFYTGGYGQYTQEERQRILGIRDAIQSNWAMHTDENGKNTILEEEINIDSSNRLQKYLFENTGLNVDEYEIIENFFNTNEWQTIRRKTPYNEDFNMSEFLGNVSTIMNYDYDKFEEILRGAQTVQDFNKKIGDYIDSII